MRHEITQGILQPLIVERLCKIEKSFYMHYNRMLKDRSTLKRGDGEDGRTNSLSPFFQVLVYYIFSVLARNWRRGRAEEFSFAL